MLLTHRTISIPQTLPSIKDTPNLSLISTTNAPALQFFNMRVTERLHRYRSMRRQWNEIATGIQTDSSLTSKSDSNFVLPDIISLAQDDVIKDYFNSTTIKNSNALELDPLHSLIQKDLIQLRKLIKARHRKLSEHLITKTMNSKLAGEHVSKSVFLSLNTSISRFSFRIMINKVFSHFSSSLLRSYSSPVSYST